MTTEVLDALGEPVTPSADGIMQVSVDITGRYLYAGVKAAVVPGSLGAVAVYKIGAGGALRRRRGPTVPHRYRYPGVARTNVVQ